MACAHLRGCAQDYCTQLRIDCSAAGSQLDCFANCVDAIPCGQLDHQTAAQCALGCLWGGDGGLGDGGDGGPESVACFQCVTMESCAPETLACATETTSGGCSAWLGCTRACYQQSPLEPGCFSACDAQFPNAEQRYRPIYACSCASCWTQCIAENACTYGMDGGA
jgi:hypothetical protein